MSEQPKLYKVFDVEEYLDTEHAYSIFRDITRTWIKQAIFKSSDTEDEYIDVATNEKHKIPSRFLERFIVPSANRQLNIPPLFLPPSDDDQE